MGLVEVELAGTELAKRLRARKGEIDQAVLGRVHAVSSIAGSTDPEYVEGLRSAVSAAIEYGIASVEHGDERPPVLPPALLTQARVAASSGISLDTVLRRYFAGYALLGDFLIEETEQAGLGGTTLKRLLRIQATLFDRLIAAITEEYGREAGRRADSPERRRVECVQKLLACEPVDSSELGYEFDAFHLAMSASGPGAAETVRATVGTLDCRLLLIRPDPTTAWAWLGRRLPLEEPELDRLVTSRSPETAALAVGEQGHGLAGWRLSHRQAVAALSIAQRGPKNPVRYAEVALLASVIRDDLLSTSLHQLYLAPLERERDGGATAREALRAYFAAERNVSSAAAALGVNRNTLAGRLQAIEEKMGRSLASAAADLEAALRLDELASSSTRAYNSAYR